MEEQFDDYHSDSLNLSVKTSQIPNAGLGVFAKRLIKSGEIIAEYRGKLIDCKKSWDYPFTWEDKMILINDQYSILGRCLAARVNDIINFNIYSYTAQEIQDIEERNKFPTHSQYKYNTFLRTRIDKVFIVAMKDIKKDEELFFSYSFEYWKFFYDEFKKHPINFFEYWFTEKQKAFQLYDEHIISDSEINKLKFQNGHIKATKNIQANEYIIEFKGQIKNQDEVFEGICLKLRNNIKLCLDEISERFVKQNQKDVQGINAELKRIDDKYFVMATYKIFAGDKIFIHKQELMQYLANSY